MAELPDFPTDPVLARKLQRLGHPAGVAIALGDPAGCIEWVNAAFQRLTGYTAAELTGKRLDLLRGLDIGEPALDYVMSRFRRGEPSHLEIRTRAGASREARWLAIEVRPLGPDEGFAALVSDGTARERVDRVADPVSRRKVPPLASLSQPRARTISPARVDVSLLVLQSSELLEAAVSGRTLLDLDLVGNPPPVMADGPLLREIVVSLVRLAAEAVAGVPSSIRVRTSVVVDGEGHDRVALEVRDTGWGMERASLARVFDSGSRGRHSQRALDLADIRGILEAHGGTLAIEGLADGGTRAVVLLPCAEP